MPPRPYVAVLVWRTLIVWSAVHVLSLTFVSLETALLLPFRSTVLALLVTVLLLLLDTERRSERRFLANLGVSRLGIAAVVTVAFLATEGILRLIVGGLANN